MSFLLEAMCVILGVMSMVAEKPIEQALMCFAVAALFNIAGNIGRRGI